MRPLNSQCPAPQQTLLSEGAVQNPPLRPCERGAEFTAPRTDRLLTLTVSSGQIACALALQGVFLEQEFA